MSLREILQDSNRSSKYKSMSVVDLILTDEDSKLEYEEMLERHREHDFVNCGVPSYFSNEDTGYFEYSDEAMNPILKVALVLLGGAIAMYAIKVMMRKKADETLNKFDGSTLWKETDHSKAMKLKEMDLRIAEANAKGKEVSSDPIIKEVVKIVVDDVDKDGGAKVFDKALKDTLDRYANVKKVVEDNRTEFEKLAEKKLEEARDRLIKVVIRLFGGLLVTHDITKVKDLENLIKELIIWQRTDISKLTGLIPEIIKSRDEIEINRLVARDLFPEHTKLMGNMPGGHWANSGIVFITKIYPSLETLNRHTTDEGIYALNTFKVAKEDLTKHFSLSKEHSASLVSIGVVISEIVNRTKGLDSNKSIIGDHLKMGKKYLEHSTKEPRSKVKMITDIIRAFETFQDQLTTNRKTMAKIVQVVESYGSKL